MRLLLCSVLSLAVVTAAAAEPPRVSVVQDAPAIVRETPEGDQRMVVLAIGNDSHEILTGLRLTCKMAEGSVSRDLLPVKPGGCGDTIWLPHPVPSTVTAQIATDAAVLWRGTLTVPEPAEVCRVPLSRTVTVDQLAPLMLRGTNYYPRESPWAGLYRHTTDATLDAEFAVMEQLHINTFRTFYQFDVEAGLVRQDGSITPRLLARICALLTYADRHHQKVMLCLGGGPQMDDLDVWRRYFRFGVEPFVHDGRILMWDLINEPGGSQGPKANETLVTWITAMYPELERLAPNHMLTVGLCWQFDQLWELGVKPPVAQYHNYSGAVGTQPQGAPPVRNVAEDLRGIREFVGERPLVIGEFGYASVVDRQRTDASPERQLEIYNGVLTGAETVGITGVYNWCLFHFEPAWMGPGEQSFGIVNLDGSLKPAGQLLRDTYARWRGRVQAPWEAR